MRRPHYLKRNATQRVPLRMIWVDTEAVNERGQIGVGRQRLTFGVAIYEHYADSKATKPISEDRIRFDVVGDFWEWCTRRCLPGRTIWVMAHNWNYDAGILNVSNELPARGWKLKKYVNGKPPLIVRWERNGAYIYMVDTMNYFSTSVASLGVATGLEKLSMPKVSASQVAWDAYAWRDVEIIKAAFLSFRAFVRENNLGVMQPTLASQAFTAYRHRFMPEPILIHDNVETLKLERDAYHGGRTDAFWYGELTEELYKVDVNSMYPFIMKSCPLSARFKAYFPSFKPRWWAKALVEYGIVARCRIETDEPIYGAVRGNRLIFPIGRFETTLTTPEIHYALAAGHIQNVTSFAIYEQGYLFREFIDYFYGLRLEYRAAGNVTYDYLCKILANSLGGKFGQSGRKWVESDKYDVIVEGEQIFQESPEDEPTLLRLRLGRTQVLLKGSESENSAPIIIAEITARGRVMLWELMKLAGIGNVYYVDTDSLVVNKGGYERLAGEMDPSQLGALKLEWQGPNAEFWAAKDYKLGPTRTIKGIKKNARKISETEYEQEMFRSWDHNLKMGHDGFIDVVLMRKNLSRINTKGVVDGVGWVRPIELKEW